MSIKGQLDNLNIIPDPLKDQFFLADNEILRKIVAFANLNKNDVVLEVGAGIGNLTGEIAKHAGRVIAFEIDEKFKPLLMDLPTNVELRFENAWDYVQLHGKFRKKKEYNKIVANLPYSFAEPLLHNLTFLEYDKVILLLPMKFLKVIDGSAVFGSFFKTKILLKVPKEKFYPVPRTNSVVIDLIKISDPLKNRDLPLFLRQYMYQREDKLVKNSLMEGLVNYAKMVLGLTITKNQARKIISNTGIPTELLESHPNNKEIYSLVSDNFKNIFD